MAVFAVMPVNAVHARKHRPVLPHGAEVRSAPVAIWPAKKAPTITPTGEGRVMTRPPTTVAVDRVSRGRRRVRAERRIPVTVAVIRAMAVAAIRRARRRTVSCSAPSRMSPSSSTGTPTAWTAAGRRGRELRDFHRWSGGQLHLQQHGRHGTAPFPLCIAVHGRPGL